MKPVQAAPPKGPGQTRGLFYFRPGGTARRGVASEPPIRYVQGMKKTLYLDMDNVLVDFKSGVARLTRAEKKRYKGRLDEVPGIYHRMEPLPDAVRSFEILSKAFDVYILSTAPWRNHSAWSDKVRWVTWYLGKPVHKRLILSHHKNLNRGHYLVDDQLEHGAGDFGGELIHFGRGKFKTWGAVVKYLLARK
jgi:5'-nucleotidase